MIDYYSAPYHVPSHNANDNGIDVVESFSSYIIRDTILQRYTSVQRDELAFNRDILHYVKDRHMAERCHIVHLLDAYFFSTWDMYDKPHYMLLGSRLGPLVMSVAQSISDIECHIYDWPTDYDQSSSWMLSNLDKSYNQYKMHLQLFGESNIYTDEEYRLVHELFRLFEGVF